MWSGSIDLPRHDPVCQPYESGCIVEPSRSPKAWVAWSSGKDSAWALYVLRRQGIAEATGFLTTVNQASTLAAVHAVREELLEAQARAVGLPLVKVAIPLPCPNVEYEQAMRQALASAREQGMIHIAFGDPFLEVIRAISGNDARRQRDDAALSPVGIRHTPTCADHGRGRCPGSPDLCRSRAAGTRFMGRTYDQHLLTKLPATVDPCGERGESHTFVYAGPMFGAALSVKAEDVVTRDGFVYADVMLNRR